MHGPQGKSDSSMGCQGVHAHSLVSPAFLDTGTDKVSMYPFHRHLSTSLSLVPLTFLLSNDETCAFSSLGTDNTPRYRHVCMAPITYSYILPPNVILLLEICSSDQRVMCKSALPESTYERHFSPATSTTLSSETTQVLGSDMPSPDRGQFTEILRFKLHIHNQRSSDHLNGLIDASSSLNQGKQQGHQQGCGQQGGDSGC